MRKFLSVFCLGWGTLTGQTLEEAKEEFRAQKLVLEEAAGEYFQAKVKAFSKKVPEGEGKAYRDQLEKAHLAWMAWAELQARAQVAPEPELKREALFWMVRASLYEQKGSELKKALGGADNFSPVVIDDVRINLEPLDIPASIYPGEMAGRKGCFALQWTEDEAVRGAFVSDDGQKIFRLFGDNSERGVVKFLCLGTGADSGEELVVRKSSGNGKLVWSGGSGTLGVVKMAKAGDAQGRREGRPAAYDGSSGETNLRMGLEWAEVGTVTGSWMDKGSGVPGEFVGLNYAEGRLYLDRWEEVGDDAERGIVKAMWFLKKTSENPVTWEGVAVYLNGYTEEVGFTKIPQE